jgi:hypothetical protein
VVLLVAIGLAAVPAFGAELRVTGFFDNIFPHWDSNLSNPDGDNDPTRGGDQGFWGRQRFRSFFNFIASDDLRGVFGIEIDNSFGAPRYDGFGSGCIETDGVFGASSCGFDRATDNNQIEVKHLYADFRIPQLPIGNRWRLGGFRFQSLPLHSSLLYNIDGGGGDLTLAFSDQASLLLSYQQIEEDLERFTGMDPASIGEDYVTGGTLLLKPLPNLDFHVPLYFLHHDAPFSSTSTGSGFVFIQNDSRNVTTEDRYYLGFDARYRIGNTRIEPTFVYLFGDRKFTDGSKIDFSGFMGHFAVGHTRGPWLFEGKFTYKSGNKADDDINNTGIGNRADVGFRQIATEADRFGQWFEIHGRSEIDGAALRVFRRFGEVGLLDRFGWMGLGGHVEYKATDSLILEGALGGFWTAETPGCPANHRIGSITGPCGGPLNSSGEPTLNFTGDSKFVGWEINSGFRYTVMPGLIWMTKLSFADYGGAFDINNRNATNAWAFANRLIYLF